MSTLQKPIESGFGPASTASDIIKGIDLSGKIAIVTGGYSGLGLETTRVLAEAGAKVIVPARDVSRAKKNVLNIKNTEVMELDLLDPNSINQFSETFLKSNQCLHILINNAGIMASPLIRDNRGLESQFATNHLGHFQLVNNLWPALVKANGARVVSVASRGHFFSEFNFEDPNYQIRTYDAWESYGQSKTANILFAVELDKRGRDSNVRAFSTHPGSIAGTGLTRHLPNDFVVNAGLVDSNGNPIINPEKDMKTISMGAATQIWCATSKQLAGLGGVYCENSDIAIITDRGNEKFDFEKHRNDIGVRPYAIDDEAALELWKLSEKLLNTITAF